MSVLRIAIAAVICITLAASPALAGNLLQRVPKDGLLQVFDACSPQRARQVLASNDMIFIAEVPRTAANYRFVVHYKRDDFGVTVRTSDCAPDVVEYARRAHPWCEYLPGLVSQCPQQDLLAN